MAYVKKPKLTVETPLGPMIAHFNSGTNIHFNQDGDQALTINRVEYTAWFTAEFADGQWQIARHKESGTLYGPSTLRIQRAGRFAMADYSGAAWKKAETVLRKWLSEWIGDQTLILASADCLDAIQQATEAQTAVERATEVLRVANMALTAAEDRCWAADQHMLSLNVNTEVAA